MNPRLKVEPLTDEDRAAWFDWQVNRRRDWALWGALEARSFLQDRRDADLMLKLAQDRVTFGRFMWPESLYEQYLTDGGDGLSAWE